MVGLSEAHRFLYGCTLSGHPVFVRLDSNKHPGIRMVGRLETSGFRMVGFFQSPAGIRMV